MDTVYTVHMDSISFYNFDNYISMDGHIKRESGMLDINICNFDFKYQDYSIKSTDTLMAYYKSDSLMIENFLLTATGEGEIEVRGMLDLSGENAVAVYFRNIQLLPFNQFVSWKYTFEGLMEISLEFLGSFKQPEIETELNIKNFKINDDFIGVPTEALKSTPLCPLPP